MLLPPVAAAGTTALRDLLRGLYLVQLQFPLQAGDSVQSVSSKWICNRPEAALNPQSPIAEGLDNQVILLIPFHQQKVKKQVWCL